MRHTCFFFFLFFLLISSQALSSRASYGPRALSLSLPLSLISLPLCLDLLARFLLTGQWVGSK